jgi:Helix-turn-helix
MVDTSKKELKRRDRAYYRRRQQNHVFAEIAGIFAEEAEKGAISKKELAEILGKNPSQITRWLAGPSNLELDTISDMLLAMGAEMDHRVVRFSERAKPNYVHPMLAPYLDDPEVTIHVEETRAAGEKTRTITATASSTASFEISGASW